MTQDGNLLPKYLMMQKALLSSLKLKDVLDAACLQFADLAGGAKVAILLSDNESMALKLMASNGYSDASKESLRVIPFTQAGLLQEVVQSRQPGVALKGSKLSDFTAAMMEREGSAVQMALPLEASSLLVGAVLLDASDAKQADQLGFLKDVGDVVALQVANAILHGRSEYERERLGTLYKTSCALSGSSLKVSEVLQKAADTALVLGNTPNCAILLSDPGGESFTLAAFKGLEGSSLKEFDLSVKGSIAGRCLESHRPEYIVDTSNDLGLPRVTGGSLVGSVVCLPMIYQGESLGVLMVFSTDSRAFHREQIDLLESLVGQVGTALHVAMTHETTASKSINDAHTGLYNRRHFEETLTKEVERGQRHKRELAVLLLDIDHLAQINDHLGQEKGDEAIRFTARVIKGALRDIDIPCRYGGEEFSIILPDTPADSAAEVAERLRQKVRSEPAPGIGMLTVSIGMAAFPGNASEPEELLKSAEQALDIAKFEGRDRVKVAQSGMPSTGPIPWEELAQQAKLSVVSERQSKLQSKLAVAPEYASWMRATPTISKKRPGEVNKASE